MEQKQLDEMDDTFFGDEFLEEEIEIIGQKDDEKFSKKNKDNKEAKKAKNSKTVAKKIEPVEEIRVKILKDDNNDIKITSAKFNKDVIKEPVKEVKEVKKEEPKVEVSPTVDPWEDESEENINKGSSFWKVIAGVLLIILIASIYTNGFGLAKGNSNGELSLSEAEMKALDFVNNNLLQEPFIAEITSSTDAGNLYQITLSVAGQEVDSYITKDGSLFFPQGFAVSDSLTLQGENNEARIDVSVDDDAVKGDVNALVTIVEFSDFECPFCGKYVLETYPQLIKEYVDTGKVKYVFRDFPLEFHLEAQKAAEAAECAGEQGKFWEMHDYLFENQDYLGVDYLKGYAKDLGLDTKDFNECLDSGAMAEEIENDLLDGQSYGVSGTPAFFINGKLISGAQPFSVFKQEIEVALAEVEGTSGDLEVSVEIEEANVVPEVEEVVEELIVLPVEEEVQAPVTVSDVVEEATVPGVVREFTLSAKKWLFSPNKVTVKKGEIVKLTIMPSDLDFSFAIPQLSVNKDVKGTTVVEFVAKDSGKFEFKCSSCEDWRGMTGSLVVE